MSATVGLDVALSHKKTHGNEVGRRRSLFEGKEREVEAEKSKKCNPSVERSSLVKRTVQGKHKEVKRHHIVPGKKLENNSSESLKCTEVGGAVENLEKEGVAPAQTSLHEKVKQNQTVLEKKIEKNNSEPCTEMEGAVENLGQEDVAPAQMSLHEETIKGNRIFLGKKLEDDNSEALKCTGVDGAVENLVKEEVTPAQTTLHDERNTVPRRHTCHSRSSSGTSGSVRTGCNIRSSSGNWHAGAFRNSLKATSPVNSVQRSFENSTGPSLKSAGEELRQVFNKDTEKLRQSLSDSWPPCTSSSPCTKSADEDVQQVLSRDTERSRQSLSDSRPPYTPRKNKFGSHSPREGVLQGNHPVMPLGSVTPESHKSVDPRTPRTPNVGIPQGNSTAVPFGSVVHESHKSIEPCSPNVGMPQGSTVVPFGLATPELHKSVELRTPSMSMGERIRRFEPRAGAR